MIECPWKCGDVSGEDHTHYAVSVRENDKLLGRLTPEGTATNRNIYAALFSQERAENIADDINKRGVFTAKAIKF